MWDQLDDEDDDGWQPLRTRHAGTIRIVALLISAAMVIALVIPVLLRIFSTDEPAPQPAEGERAMTAIVWHADAPPSLGP